jgi:hypothetical protein
MTVRNERMAGWLLLTFSLPTKRASQRVEIWRKLQRYGTVPLGNSGYLLPSDPSNEERFQWLATTIRKYGGEASVVRVESIGNISTPHLRGRFCEARAREYQELIQEIKALPGADGGRVRGARLGRLRNRFQEIVEVDFFDARCRHAFANSWNRRVPRPQPIQAERRFTRKITRTECGSHGRGQEWTAALPPG